MSQPAIVHPKIEIFLEGLLVIFVSSDNRECKVGLLRETPPHHNLAIKVIKRPAAGGPFEPVCTLGDADLADELRVDVTGTSESGIRRRPSLPPIDRFTGTGNPNAFEWLFHFERDFYHRTIGARRNRFRSLITINNGDIFTQKISENHLQFRQGNSGLFADFGHVAVITGIEISLDTPGSKAVFLNGRQVVFQTEPNTSYQINVDRGDDGTHVPGSDGDFYFTAMGPGLSPHEHLHFRSYPAPNPSLPNTPDACCLNGGSDGPLT